jgi:hypothetical protein
VIAAAASSDSIISTEKGSSVASGEPRLCARDQVTAFFRAEPAKQNAVAGGPVERASVGVRFIEEDGGGGPGVRLWKKPP